VSRDAYTCIFEGLEFVGFERVSFMRADNFTGGDTGCIVLCFTALHHASLMRVHNCNACRRFVSIPLRRQVLWVHCLGRDSVLLVNSASRRSRWPRGLKRGAAAARLLGLRVRIPPGAWMFVSCDCFVRVVR
jgi:hypothetical protein